MFTPVQGTQTEQAKVGLPLVPTCGHVKHGDFRRVLARSLHHLVQELGHVLGFYRKGRQLKIRGFPDKEKSSIQTGKMSKRAQGF